MAAVFGGTQSLHTNSFDEAIALPTDFSARIARNTQLILQEETHITGVVDPWAGSYMMEKLTQDMADKAWAIIEEVEAHGRHDEGRRSRAGRSCASRRCAAEKQARIDRGEDVIVGVNKYRLEEEAPVEIREIDNTAVRDAQIARLREVKAAARREGGATRRSRRSPMRAHRQGQPARARDRRDARASDGRRGVRRARERSGAATRRASQTVSGVYGAAFEQDAGWQALKADVEAFAAEEGRRPRIMVAKLGQDGHDRGAKVIATAFADLGFDVDIGPLFQTPEEAARQAIENDVHAVGVSTLAAGHKTLVPAARRGAARAGRAETSSWSSAA